MYYITHGQNKLENKILNKNAFSEQEVIDAQNLWADQVLQIGYLYTSNLDYKTTNLSTTLIMVPPPPPALSPPAPRCEGDRNMRPCDDYSPTIAAGRGREVMYANSGSQA